MLKLPEGFGTWSTEDRLAWHEKRIEKETPVFAMLEQAEIFTCFNIAEIKARLHRVRWWSQAVLDAIRMQTSPEFEEIKRALDEAVVGVKSIAKKRCDIMIQVFCTDVGGYQEEVDELKARQETVMEKVELQEQELVELCATYRVPPEPYLVYDKLKEQL